MVEANRCAPRTSILALVVLIAAQLVPARGHAWILHEHWAIARHGVEHQHETYLKELRELWGRLAAKYPERFCKDPVGTGEALKEGKRCVDFAVLSALAGDHSCSPNELWHYVRDEAWVLNVIEVAGKVAVEMQNAATPTEVNDIWDLSHLQLEAADAEYSTRAGENTAHFLGSRLTGQLDTYVLSSLGSEAPSNALAIYIDYHLAALRLALDSYELAKTDQDAADKLLLRALFAEAYAQHFLEDTYSSGHTVASWGDVATRKGTHDHYSINGLDAHTWDGHTYSARGDAHMREQDLNRAGAAVADSLRQVLDAARGEPEVAEAIKGLKPEAAKSFEDFNTCRARFMSRHVPDEAQLALVQPIVVQTIMPGRMDGDGAYPRFRAELGPFVRLYAAVAGGAAFAGYQTDEYDLQGSPRARSTFAIGGAIGIGLNGITGRSGDGSAFLQAAFLLDTTQQDGPCGDCSDTVKNIYHRGADSLASRVPSRNGLELRLRAPYWLLPGDLILASTVLIWASPDTLKAMGMRAVRGGLIPWQRTLLTSIGTFQFVIGREFGLNLRGFNGANDRYLYQAEDPAGTTRFYPVEYRTLELDVPVLEYKPYRDFQSRVTTAVLFQLGFMVEFLNQAEFAPADVGGVTIIPPGGAPELKDSYFVYMRLAFDGRAYF